MEYRQIDCKMKEIYFESKPIQEEEDILRSRLDFWMKMNCMAIQNMSIQRIKSA